MRHKKPIDLNLLKLRFPVTAISSILHRVTGVLLFILLPVYLYLLAYSLQSPASLLHLQHCAGTAFGIALKVVLTGIVVYHVLAGIRHIVMDFGLGESRRASQISAWTVMLVSLLLTVLLGVNG